MKIKEIKNIISTKFKTFSYSKKDDTFTAKKSYFWVVTMSGDHLVPAIKELFPDAEILNFGNHYRPFCGGAKSGSAKDSYYFIKFRVKHD